MGINKKENYKSNVNFKTTINEPHIFTLLTDVIDSEAYNSNKSYLIGNRVHGNANLNKGYSNIFFLKGIIKVNCY